MKVLMLARELGHLKKVGGISVDGTKINANASKHAAVSYKRAGEMVEQLELEIAELVRKADEADSAPLKDGLTLPGEIARRADRKAALERARAVIEERYEEARQDAQREFEAKKAAREEKRKNGFSEAAVLEVEANGEGPKVYCAVEKQDRHRNVADLVKKADPPPPPEGATVKEMMARRLKTEAGRAVYKKRKETVEPVFGIIKAVMGFRQFLMRGLEKVATEWGLVTLAYNVKRLHKLCGGRLMPGNLEIQPQNI